MGPADLVARYRHCRESFVFFADRYCQVLSDAGGPEARWIPFRLWPAQKPVAELLQQHRLLIILKARQLGLTWLTLAFASWLLLFYPIATVLLFSRRDDEATELLRKLKGMYARLPEWLLSRAVVLDNDHEWELANGSRVLAFPTTAGDSYTASLAIVDEADLCPDLGRLMRAVKPTIDGGGKMILLSRSDSTKPQSHFKRIYQSAKQGLTDWHPIFLPWSTRPGRDAAWYAAQRADVLHRTGALDDLYEQYPATDAEALSPRTLDKRLALVWLQQCYRELAPIPVEKLPPGAPAIPGLAVYVPPVAGRKYVIGLDPAEGNPTSDDSALTVLDADSGEEVASLAAKLQPAQLAAHADLVGKWFNSAPVLCERNNHGHAVLLWLADYSPLVLLKGIDGKAGWHSTSLGKSRLYDATADAFRNGETVIHSFASYVQLSSIEGSTLRAPEGEHEDRADSYALALVGRIDARAQRGAIGVPQGKARSPFSQISQQW